MHAGLQCSPDAQTCCSVYRSSIPVPIFEIVTSK